MDKLFTKAEIETTDKGLVAVASSAVEDRHGEVVEVQGWDLKNFKKNPVLQWAHDPYIPAIGTAKNIRIDGEGKKARLVFEPIFHEATEFARGIKRLYEEKILNSFSVGFRPLEIDGNAYLSQELLEISAVNVPANPDARMLAYKSLNAAGLAQETIDQIVPDTGAAVAQRLTDEVERLAEEVATLQEQYNDVVKGIKHLNPRVDKQEVAVVRVSLAKVISRATDKALEGKPNTQAELAAFKVIKRASDRLSHDLKRDLKNNGTNQRTA